MKDSEQTELAKNVKRVAAEARQFGLNRDAILLEVSYAEGVVTPEEIQELDGKIRHQKLQASAVQPPAMALSQS